MDDRDHDPTGAGAYLCQINITEMAIIGQNFAPKQKFNTRGAEVSELDGTLKKNEKITPGSIHINQYIISCS